MIEENTQNEKKLSSQEGGIGALIGSIIIVIILILGGWYIWQEAKKINNLPPIETEITIDEIDSIESIILDDEILDLDAELDSIDIEFE